MPTSLPKSNQNNTVRQELLALDALLKELSQQRGMKILKEEFSKNPHHSSERINFLMQEGMLKKESAPPPYYLLTNRGLIFLLRGGYMGEYNQVKDDKRLNRFYLWVTPTIALLSVVISSLTLLYTIKKEEQREFQLTNELTLSFKDLPADTTIRLQDTLPPVSAPVTSVQVLSDKPETEL